MRLRAALFALLLCASVAPAAEVRTLKGEKFTGDIVSINAKEIVVDVAGVQKTFLASQIIDITYGTPPKLSIDVKYTDVELVDGTLLHCAEFGIKKSEVTVKLLGSDVVVKIPLDSVANVLRSAQDEKLRKEWNERISKKRNTDAVAVKSDDTVNAIGCTILEADEKGENISFKKGDETLSRPLANFIGLMFQRRINPDAPPVVCKLLDAGHNNIMVAGVESKEDGLHVQTSAGVTIVYKPTQLARLDYSSANIAYLSDMTPSKIIETSTDEWIDHYRKDRNLDNGPLRLMGQVYPKGLSLHSTTELEYKLKGDFRTFQAMAGIDDLVSGHNKVVVLQILMDGKLVKEETFSRTERKEKVKAINLNVKDVQLLTIRVTHTDKEITDTGAHLDLADARVIK